MILFVFEGRKREVALYNVFGPLFFGRNNTVVAVYECNIDALYHEMVELGDGADIVSILRSRYEGREDNPFEMVSRSDDFSEIYLVFDYDFHDTSRTPDILNEQLQYLLDYFKEETDKGKLYINYPMVEAIAYTKALPDADYNNYVITREQCKDFKRLTHDFSYYPNFDFILRGDSDRLRENWNHLMSQNVNKARYICESSDISQENILKCQVDKYERMEGCKIAVLSAFALLLYDWCRE